MLEIGTVYSSRDGSTGPIRPWPPIQFCHGLWPTSSEGKQFCSPKFPNFCDYFVKKVVSEIRKCRQLQGNEVPLKLRPSDPLTIIVWYRHAPTLLCSLNIINLCNNFVKKLVSEIRKCRQLQRDKVPLSGL